MSEKTLPFFPPTIKRGYKPFDLVRCVDCGKEWYKRRYDSFSGRCKCCAMSEMCNRPEMVARRSAAARQQILRQGGVPNAVKFTSERSVGKANWKWRGGLPKCVDCGKSLGAYRAKRCVQCEGKTRIGIQRPIEVSLKQSASAKRGADHPRWRGGQAIRKSFWQSLEYKTWRRKVYERDNYTCQRCGIYSKKGRPADLNAHHIKPQSEFPELRCEVANGLTLCRDCHQKTDSFGWKQAMKLLARGKTIGVNE